MRAYRLDCEAMSISTGKLKDTSAEISVSSRVIADSFARKISSVKRLLNDPAGERLTFSGGLTNPTTAAIRDALEVASINTDVCTVYVEVSASDTLFKWFIRPIFVEELSDTRNFVDTRQQGRQEVYNFIKGYLAIDPDPVCALSAAAAEFNLDDQEN